MVWFFAGIILFTITLIVFLGCLTLWVYHDATAKSNQSAVLWILLVLLVPNFMGLIVYLLVGRTNKNAASPKKYFRAAIVSAIFFALGTAALVGGVIYFTVSERQNSSHQIGLFVARDEFFRNGVWKINAGSANGHIRRTPVLTGDEMENFQIFSETRTGNVILRIEQNNREEIFNISNFSGEKINLSGFAPGNFILTVEFENAEGVRIEIRWQ
jgi:hypothetical protein